VKYAIVTLILLTIAGVASAQPLPPIPGDLPPIPEDAQVVTDETRLNDAALLATKQQLPLIVYVGTPVRSLQGTIGVRVEEANGSWEPRILVRKVGSDRGLFLAVNSSEKDIRNLIGGEAQAVPFESVKSSRKAQQPAQREAGEALAVAGDDDNGPWLSKQETAAIKARWSKGLAFPDNLKFYSLEPRYQNLWTQNGGRFKGWRADPITDYESRQFMFSGGMKDIDHRTWRSIKGLAIPDGKKIAAWKEDTDVRAFALVPRWRWQFPQGTIAYDVLFKVDADDWTIFEIRTQEKLETNWSTGDVAFTDEKIAPKGFHGAGQSCASCHSHAHGELLSVPGQIYLVARWGDDGRFSWRPFKDDGTLDTRWPLEMTRGAVASVQAVQGEAEESPRYGGMGSMQQRQGSMRQGLFGRRGR